MGCYSKIVRKHGVTDAMLHRTPQERDSVVRMNGGVPISAKEARRIAAANRKIATDMRKIQRNIEVMRQREWALQVLAGFPGILPAVPAVFTPKGGVK